jgi:hypothetical protein
MPVQNGIFYEPQRGGQCRLHSINAFFGSAKINDGQFETYKKTYDGHIKTKFNSEVSCSSYDIFNADQNTIISYILGLHGYATRLSPFNAHYAKPLNISDIKGNFFFVFNQGHIWGMRKKENNWYKVDSLSGVTVCSLSSIKNTKNIGMIIPVDMKSEFYRNVNILKKEIFETDITPEFDIKNTREAIKKYIIKANKNKLVLSEIEIPLTIVMDILEMQLQRVPLVSSRYAKPYAPIERLVNVFNEFYPLFTDGNYNDVGLILKYLPTILEELLHLDNRKYNIKVYF